MIDPTILHLLLLVFSFFFFFSLILESFIFLSAKVGAPIHNILLLTTLYLFPPCPHTICCILDVLDPKDEVLRHMGAKLNIEEEMSSLVSHGHVECRG